MTAIQRDQTMDYLRHCHKNARQVVDFARFIAGQIKVSG